MTHTKRATFGSKIGVILATVGCAVGLGNIWRFPYMLGENGGAAFLLVYISCILFLGIPVMITEFFIGRYSRKNAAGAFKVMAPGTKWSVIGYNGVAAAFLILGYYAVVSGWTLEYIVQAFSGSLEGKNATDFADEFTAFSTGVFRPILWTVVFIALTHIIIVSGVKEGIERASKVMMPMLFLILIALCVRSITLPGASEGLTFLFNPDFSKIDSSVVLSAMGQAFFSLSIGMGCLITYASYFGKQTNLQTTALQVTILDTLVAVLAGVMIFPAVIAVRQHLVVRLLRAFGFGGIDLNDLVARGIDRLRTRGISRLAQEGGNHRLGRCHDCRHTLFALNGRPELLYAFRT